MTDPPAHEITDLLNAAAGGVPGARDDAMAAVYAELKRLAASFLRRERDDHTLGPTALVHEAYLRLAGQDRTAWQNRHHFYGIAAQAMRRILVDHARRRGAARRDAGRSVTLRDSLDAAPAPGEDLVAVDEALERLARLDERQARLVELRYFAGLTIEEAAEALGVSPATVKREWLSARAWLQRELG